MLRNMHSNENLDRFIPNRSAMDFDFARYMLTCGGKDNVGSSSSSKHLYRKHLAEILNMNRTRILAFKNKAPPSAKNLDGPFLEQGTPNTQFIMKRRLISQSPERVLDAPDIVDDFYLNLLDWGCNNVIAIALGNSVYLWAASDGSTSELLSVNDDIGPVTSLKWAPDGRYLAVGFSNSHVQLWDSATTRLLRTLQGGHRLRVGSVDWNEHVLTTGGMDSMIINNDVRIRSHIVSRYRGHSEEVCGLTWCSSGTQLASGGNDNLVHIWCASMASSNQWLHRFNDHSAAVKALSWCPFQSNLLASGGGVGDSCIKFWNTNTGACFNSVNTGSQVCSLLWSTHESELLSGHGYNDYQLALWKYPSMVKIAELYGHTSRVLSMAQSPYGCVASVAGDEMLRIWNVFGTPPLTKPGSVMKQDLFPNIPRIR